MTNTDVFIGIIGSNEQNSTQVQRSIALELGKLLIDNSYRIICGGMGGIMNSVSKGAKESKNWEKKL